MKQTEVKLLTPKKSLGQNFFINKNLADQIVKKILFLSFPIDPLQKGGETFNNIRMIEIGPGTGIFTNQFAQNGILLKNITVVEKDAYIASQWSNYFPNTKLINEDFLSVNLIELFTPQKPTFIFGSLPYNISKKIIKKCLKELYSENEFSDIKLFFIIQKEVAEKYTEKYEKSALATSTNIYANSKILLEISPHSFSPKPKVRSSLIMFSKNKNLGLLKERKPFTQKQNADLFEQFVYSIFSKKRQKLYKSLIPLIKLGDIQKALTDKGILDRRVHQISFEQIVNVYNFIDTGSLIEHKF